MREIADKLKLIGYNTTCRDSKVVVAEIPQLAYTSARRIDAYLGTQLDKEVFVEVYYLVGDPRAYITVGY